jgi:hypothetical protein
MHVPPHSTIPAWQLTAHFPAEQTVPLGQAFPAFAPAQSPLAPQCALLVAGSMHVPPHWTCPAKHVTAHLPPEQTVPLAQAVPALAPEHAPLAPQWALSVLGSMQLPPHSIVPLGQLSAHVPAAQTLPAAQAAPALAPAQSPLAPQCALLVAGSMQVPSQATSPA